MRIVLLTADPSMGRPRDRAILRDNESWARQVIERRTVTAGENEYVHHHAHGPHGNAAAVRRTIIDAYRAAASFAGARAVEWW